VNILFICEVDWNRKVVYDMQLLAEAMSVRGHNIYVIDYTNRNNGVGQETVSRAIDGASVELIHPPFLNIIGLNRVTAFMSHYYKIKEIIKKKAIDAIVLYSVPTNGLQALYLATKYDIPIVFRSLDILNRMIHYPILPILTKRMESYVYSRVDKFLAITPRLSDYAVILGANSGNVEYLPMTVDTELFKLMEKSAGLMERWGIGEDDKVILFMGTLFNFSGLDDIIYQIAHKMRTSEKIKLLIVGDGEQKEKLTDIIVGCGLGDKVIITGFQPYRDMPKYISMADVCILPFIENDITRDIFPGKIVQYLACGKPVIIRSLDGVKAVIVGEEQGVLYGDNDNRLISLTVELLEDSERRDRIGRAGYEYVNKYHSSDKVAEQLEGILTGLKEKMYV